MPMMRKSLSAVSSEKELAKLHERSVDRSIEKMQLGCSKLNKTVTSGL